MSLNCYFQSISSEIRNMLQLGHYSGIKYVDISAVTLLDCKSGWSGGMKKLLWPDLFFSGGFHIGALPLLPFSSLSWLAQYNLLLLNVEASWTMSATENFPWHLTEANIKMNAHMRCFNLCIWVQHNKAQQKNCKPYESLMKKDFCMLKCEVNILEESFWFPLCSTSSNT